MRTTTQQYDLLELSGGDPEIATILSTSDDLQELEAVRDAMQVEPVEPVESLTQLRFAVRPSLGPGQQYGMHERGGNGPDQHDLVPIAKFAGK